MDDSMPDGLLPNSKAQEEVKSLEDFVEGFIPADRSELYKLAMTCVRTKKVETAAMLIKEYADNQLHKKEPQAC